MCPLVVAREHPLPPKKRPDQRRDTDGMAGSVEVTQACGLAGFLHQGTQLELLAGQQAHVLRGDRGREDISRR